LFPTSSVFLSRWMPTSTVKGQPDEKAWGTSMLDIGISIGSLLIIPVVTVLAENVGWRHTFLCVGAASLGFVALYMWLGADEPSQCWFISPRELSYLEKHVSSQPTVSARATPSSSSSSSSSSSTWIGIPWKMARHPGLWAIFICHIAFNFGAYYLTNWSPTYYKDVLHLQPNEAKLHLMCPHIANLLIRFMNPALITAVARAGVSLLNSRKIFTVFGYLAAASSLAPVYALSDLSPWVSTALFSLANACFGLAPTGFKSNYLDITQNYVGIVAGYGNTLGTVASIVGPKITAATLVRTDGNWHAVILTVCAVNVVAAMNYARNAVVSPIEKMIDEETDNSGIGKKRR
jgi:sugar phosphate permease